MEEFNFEEVVDGTDHEQVPVDQRRPGPCGPRITDAFAKYGWMRPRSAASRAAARSRACRCTPSTTDDGDVAMKCPTEIAITDRREYELHDLGFLPLVHCKNTDFAAFFGGQSCQKPQDLLHRGGQRQRRAVGEVALHPAMPRVSPTTSR